MSRPRRPIVTLAEAAQSVLARWTKGNLADAVRELDQALRQHHKASQRRKPHPLRPGMEGSRHDRR